LPGLVFTTGDNAYPHATAEDYRRCYDPTWGRFKDRTLPVPGNHEYHTPDAAAYFDYFGPVAGTPGHGYYSLDLGDWHLVLLDSNVDATIGSPQEQWLRADLKASKRNCIAAVWHHPVFSSGGHGNNATMADAWRDLVEFRADVLVSGHDHDYERFAPLNVGGNFDPVGGVREFVVGTGGAFLTDFLILKAHSEMRHSTHGVLKLTLHPQSYDWEFLPATGGTPLDRGHTACHRT
jgi:3',5'-cyclic AMP phosphodiesterase CpdA